MADKTTNRPSSKFIGEEIIPLNSDNLLEKTPACPSAFLWHEEEFQIHQIISEWKETGRVPNDKRYVEGKFNKNLDELFSKLKMDKNEVELIKFENKLEVLSNEDNNQNLDNERFFIRKKIDEIKGQINQLENNLQFFTNVNDDNPLVKEVHNNIKNHKDSLKLWKTKLSKIKELY